MNLRYNLLREFTGWHRWGSCCAVGAGSVLTCFEVKGAVLQQAGHVAEVTDRAQAMQLLVHVPLLPAAIAPTHLTRER